MMAVLCDGRTALPEGEPRQFKSYAATTRSTAKPLSTRVDASSDASRVGGVPDTPRPLRERTGWCWRRRGGFTAGIMQHQELAWERIGV